MEKWHNGTMLLDFVMTMEKEGDNVSVFARLNGDGTIYDYVIGHKCNFDRQEKTVSWCWGHYNYGNVTDALNDAKAILN